MSDAIDSGGGTPQRRKPRKLQKRQGTRGSVDEGSTNTLMSPISPQVEEGAGQAEERGLFDRRDSDLTDLPVDDRGFLDDVRQDAPMGLEGDSMDEGEMRRHFMDVESSFLPEGASGELGGRAGVDDTYLELGRPGHAEAMEKGTGSARRSRQVSNQGQESGEEEAETPADAYKTPGAGRYEDGEEEEEGEEDDAHEDMGGEGSPSSPAQAAAHRTHARINSTASATRITPVRATSISVQSDSSDPQPGTPLARPTSKGSTIRPGSSDGPEDVSLPESETPSMLSLNGVHSMSPSRLDVRPSYMSRHASQQSSMSTSTMASLSSSETAVNADYALQTGGAISSSTTRLGQSRGRSELLRLPSFGSVVSYMDRDSDGPPTMSQGASNSMLTSKFGGRLDGLEEERPETPRASTFSMQAPTDTVLAQRVESIQVPETIARDFRARNRSPGRPSSSGGNGIGTQDRPRRTLTLKEQNSKIDKLTKENFDLKLKIHFLDQALQSRSDDGVKELIDKNVQFQTDLANERKESQNLRRKVRELERRVQEQEDGLKEALKRRTIEEDEQSDDDPTLQAEMHEEILYLRQQLDHFENKVTTLREETMTKELEKRKMAEHMRSMAGNRDEASAGVKETMDMWQDLLNAETGRREQAEEDLRKLREELTSLRIERASPAAHKMMKRRSRPGTATDEPAYTNGVNGAPTDSSATLADSLKHENAELRRDLGAQTSMLTSRNRERERLQQEIEDLKLLQRKSDGGRSVTGESIFERSISRAHQRAPSRASDHTQATQVTEAERDDWDKKEGQLRDQNAELRLKFQELERTHGTHLQYVSALEGDFQEMEQELQEQAEDLQALQRERDEALHAFEDKESEISKLEQEALGEIDKLTTEVESLEVQLQDAQKRSLKIQTKLENTTDGYKGLQGELREITQSVMNLEDEKQANMRTMQALEQHLAEAEDEIEKWELKCKELDQKSRKLEITQESLHSEINFLREEQEGDKIKIGELEDALNAAQQTIQDEQEKLRELEEAIVDERQQRDVLENQSKEEVQKVLDDLNTEGGRTKDEVRKLRRALSAKEVEASTWKQKLEELEQGFRSALGEPDGTKQSMLAEVERLQRELENTANALDRAKMDAADKDRLLRHRDGLLESTSLESRRLSDLLDKERSHRRHDIEQFEKSSRGQATHMREIAHHQSRVLELETAYSQDKRKMSALEQQFREQLSERNNLLLALWNRLSTLCGQEWAQAHSQVNGENPSADVIQRNMTPFTKNVLAAVKTIEALIGSFKVRIRGIEKDLWRDYSTIEHNLDIRVRRMDALEAAVLDTQRAIAEKSAALEAERQQLQQQQQQSRPSAIRSMSSKSIMKNNDELNKLKAEVKTLKAELKFHRQHPSPVAQQMINNQTNLGPEHARRQSNGAGSVSNIGGGKSTPSPARAMVAQLLRHHSTSAVEQQLQSPGSRGGGGHYDGGASEEGGSSMRTDLPRPSQLQSQQHQPIVLATPPIQPSEQRWVHRLKELERRLKAEREARLLDRRGARQRLEEGRLENEELRGMLEREKGRRESGYFDEVGSLGGSERVKSRAGTVVGKEVD
ncbi:hypothetical protein LTR91_006356 [Friedmanniomyces endolithicus]|uniref:Centrosomin N-terminal motif 1 domain-containing protein n=1 Tax=Friedmanniomyces endolithicus TaxID=329885 RepID=A0AAN6QWY3_9PEZI|nr:hypothetical protein LTR35_002108 [Friedmanniomyces endolithicus]KAK0299847.1 hypothetical protein LTS00_001617 [Friedmanniomyces endolithicus]KAK0319326.1 hypothetical protein LTR82_009743 [Friedmanniomyces endolithicus]KAK0900393.1 hypothetical protein LTR57_020642 [Friedmanniomyces endolithicus]KAK0965747.1 hypothetical protein LTS01_018199 [Friedmanniomyces endolithicus]